MLLYHSTSPQFTSIYSMSSAVTGERLGLRDEIRSLKIGKSFKKSLKPSASSSSSSSSSNLSSVKLGKRQSSALNSSACNGVNNGLNLSINAFHSIRCKLSSSFSSLQCDIAALFVAALLSHVHPYVTYHQYHYHHLQCSLALFHCLHGCFQSPQFSLLLSSLRSSDGIGSIGS